MPDLIPMLNASSVAWAAAMFAVLWQSTLLAFVIGGIAWLFRKGSPALRYWLWQIVALKMLVMPFWTMAVPLPDIISKNLLHWETPADLATEQNPAASTNAANAFPSADTPAETSVKSSDVSTAPGANRRELPLPSLSWTGWLMLLWGLVVLGQLLLIGWQHRWLGQLLRTVSPSRPELAGRVRALAQELRLRKIPEVLITREDCSPFVCRLWRPKLILPAALADAASRGELDPVLLHELVHLRRRDLVWIWIPQLARMVYWFHPLTHWLIHRIRLEAELSCDGIAMATSGQPAGDYAKMLVDVMNRLAEPPVLRASPETVGIEGDPS